jgi:hypothetical protein
LDKEDHKASPLALLKTNSASAHCAGVFQQNRSRVRIRGIRKQPFANTIFLYSLTVSYRGATVIAGGNFERPEFGRHEPLALLTPSDFRGQRSGWLDQGLDVDALFLARRGGARC